MRGRVAIRKLEPVTTAALATAAAGTVGRVVAGKAAKGAAKTAAKQTFVDKVKDSAAQQAGKNLANAPKNLAESAGEKVAEQNRQAQASMEQRGQQMAEKAKHGSQITTGEPMNLAWRMLKGELQLPHQITDALRSDLTTLDRAHKMTDTNEGTLIENIHPDMENVVKLLADKHFEDMPKTIERPTVPLFHGQFH